MTLDEYEEAALRTAPSNVDCGHDLIHGALGVATESGELLDALKKKHAYAKALDVVNVREEIGDVLWYLALLCRATNTTLDQVATRNVEKLRIRYPHKFDTENALNRDLAAERNSLEKL